MPFNAMQGGLTSAIGNPMLQTIYPMLQTIYPMLLAFPWLQATYPMLRRGIEPRTQVSKTHVMTISLSERILMSYP